ncbi:hypothetical protein OC842_007916, partial [Tilletia horrida]
MPSPSASLARRTLPAPTPTSISVSMGEARVKQPLRFPLLQQKRGVPKRAVLQSSSPRSPSRAQNAEISAVKAGKARALDSSLPPAGGDGSATLNSFLQAAQAESAQPQSEPSEIIIITSTLQQQEQQLSSTSPPETWTPAQRALVHSPLHIRSFLESHPTQLSVYGLFALAAALRPGKLYAFFKNTHLSCLYRRREEE